MRFMTCPACGAVGHTARGGLCSRTALAEQAVRAGEMTVAEAAELHGIHIGAVYSRQHRIRNRASFWETFDRRARIQVIAERRHQLWLGHACPAGDRPTLSWPDELEVPAVDARGSDHEEVPDPPHLTKVGWNHHRGARLIRW